MTELGHVAWALLVLAAAIWATVSYSNRVQARVNKHGVSRLEWYSQYAVPVIVAAAGIVIGAYLE